MLTKTLLLDVIERLEDVQLVNKDIDNVDFRFEQLEDLKGILDFENLKMPCLLISLQNKDTEVNRTRVSKLKKKIPNMVIDSRNKRVNHSNNLLSELNEADSAFGVSVDNTDVSNGPLLGSPLQMRRFHYEGPKISDSSNYTQNLNFEYIPSVRTGVPTKLARSILSLYITTMSGRNSKLRSLYILCDGSQKIEALGICVNGNGRGLFSQISNSKEYLPSQNLVKIFEDKHLSNCLGSQIETREYYSSYNISMSSQESIANVVIRLYWSKNDAILTMPSSCTKCLLICRSDDKDDSGVLSPYLKDIGIIKDLNSFMEDFKVTEPWPISSTKTLEQVQDNMKMLFKEIENKTKINANYFNYVNNNDLSNSVRTVVDLDFIDKIWILLKECSSYQDLTECFRLLFQSMSSYKIVYKIHADKTCRLAELLRDSNQKRLVLPSLLNELLPVELFVGCGVDKVTADYVYMLKMKKLISSDDVSSVFNGCSTISSLVNTLPVLHTVAHISLNVAIYVSSDLQFLVKCVRFVFNQLKNDHAASEFHIPISYSDIYENIANTPADIWCCTIASICCDTSISSCLTLLLKESENPHSQADESKIEKNNLYEYSTNYQLLFRNI